MKERVLGVARLWLLLKGLPCLLSAEVKGMGEEDGEILQAALDGLGAGGTFSERRGKRRISRGQSVRSARDKRRKEGRTGA